MSWSVLKYGGSSVADSQLWGNIQKEITTKMDQGHRPFLVLSALKNVSNLLEALLHQALAGVHSKAIFQLKELHFQFAAELGVNGELILSGDFDELKHHCETIARLQTITPKLHAQVVAMGEILSTRIAVAYFNNVGIDALWLDARDFLIAENQAEHDPWHHYTSNQCNYRAPLTAQLLGLAENQLGITQGFIAADPAGDTVLLGREGSDTSASYFAARLNASQLEIWTDVPGIFSINPRDVSEARQICEISYANATLLSRAGAKVLHPRALAPVQEKNILTYVKSTKYPELSGTLIHNSVAPLTGVIGMAKEEAVTVIKDFSHGESVLSALMIMGFDQIELEYEQDDVVIMSYRNTEQQQPSDEQLARQFSINIDSGQTLITILGSSDDCRWMEDVNRHLASQYGERVCQCLTNKRQGLMSILTAEYFASELLAQLHVGLIQNRQDNTFGYQWNELTQIV